MSTRPTSLVLVTDAAVEPITLTEAKLFLRVDSTSFAADVTSVESIAPGSQGVAAGYSLKGAGVAVGGAAETVVVLSVGAVGAGGTIDVKLQDSATNIDANYADVPGGAFAQVTGAGANATYTIAYTGTKAWVRVVVTVGVAASSFGVNVTYRAGTSPEDALISSLITAARQKVEADTRRALITQTWDAFLEYFPQLFDFGVALNQIMAISQQQRNLEVILPMSPLQSVSFIKYMDTTGVVQTQDPATYIVDANAEPGAVRPAYNVFWPYTRIQYNAIQIRYLAGYGASGAAVPEALKHAIKLLVSHYYDNREPVLAGTRAAALEIPLGYEALIWQYKVLNVS